MSDTHETKEEMTTVEGEDPIGKTRWIVESALELKAELPVVLDMRTLTAYADHFVILTGRSDRQVRAIADAIVQTLKGHGEQPLGVEGLDDGNWVLIDCNDVIVHVFDPETRIQYDLERLWRDAKRVDLGIPGIDPDPRPASSEHGAEYEGEDSETPAA